MEMFNVCLKADE